MPKSMLALPPRPYCVPRATVKAQGPAAPAAPSAVHSAGRVCPRGRTAVELADLPPQYRRCSGVTHAVARPMQVGGTMGARDYYFSNKAMPTLGRMWILKLLQDATSSGGGGHLLGSVVQEAREGGLLGHWGHPYPVPMLMSTAGVVIGALENNRSMLGLAPTDPVVLSQRLAASLQTVTVGRDEAFSADVGPFPSLPATF